jgi:hypothetical protein
MSARAASALAVCGEALANWRQLLRKLGQAMPLAAGASESASIKSIRVVHLD